MWIDDEHLNPVCNTPCLFSITQERLCALPPPPNLLHTTGGSRHPRPRALHLQHDGQLLGRLLVVRPVREPQVEGRELLAEEGGGPELRGVALGDEAGQLHEAHLRRHVPRLRARVGVGVCMCVQGMQGMGLGVWGVGRGA